MKIAYDLRRIANPGVGRYMKNLVDTVIPLSPQHEYLFILAAGTDHLIDAHPGVRKIYARSKYYSIGEQIELPLILIKEGVDLLHAPHFVVPIVKTCPTIVTVHDTILLVYPHELESLAARIYSRWMIKLATKIADHIITVSDYSKSDLVRILKADPRKITVIPAFIDGSMQAVEDQEKIGAVRSKLGIQRNYILYMGIFRERKNHVGLLRAFAQVLRSGFDVDLVISGPIGQGKALLSQLSRDLGIEGHLVFPGFVEERDIPALYSGASVYACPSLYEGFGQTPLEAMACGIPVVCHNGTSLPEVCGKAALFGDARDPEDFASILCQALGDSAMRSQMIRMGYANIQRFSSTRTGETILQLYNKVLDPTFLSAAVA
jgi:glycosyltransferase involved in cell wall biosynthesis